MVKYSDLTPEQLIKFKAKRKQIYLKRYNNPIIKKQIYEENKKRGYINRLWFKNYKKDKKCEMCGESRTPTLVFHHKNPKEKIHSVLYYVGTSSLKKLINEINKCQILCSNCHRIYHWKNSLHNYQGRKWFKDYKKTLYCQKCKCNNFVVLEFHHFNIKIKENTVAELLNNGANKNKVIDEIKKCICLCSNCHMVLHWNEKNNNSIH